MRKLFIFSISIIILLIFGTILGFIQKKNSSTFEFNGFLQTQDLETLKIKQVHPAVYGFKTLDEEVIEIGTERHSPPQPYLKLNKWDGEVFLKVNIPFITKEKPVLKDNKITYSTVNTQHLVKDNWWQKVISKLFIFAKASQKNQPQIDIVFYPREPEEIVEIDDQGQEHRFIQNEQGGVEFDTILYQRPETNKIIFPIETKGLKFYYQGELTQEEKDNGAFRPENIVGSYAVYHESKQGDYSKLGSKDYKTGKVFHIYRPQIEDSNNKRCWGNLKIRNNFLTIEIPQEFLDEAVYPVRVDPIFGYNQIGGSTQHSDDRITGSVFTITAAGVVNNIKARFEGKGALCPEGTYSRCMIYRHSDSALAGRTGQDDCPCGASDCWNTFSFSSPKPGLVYNNDYVLTCWMNMGTYDMYYDDGDDSIQGHYQSLTYSSTPPAFASFTHEDRKYSIYSTYTVATTTIPVGYQEFSTSSFDYGSGTDLTVYINMPIELNLSKPISYPSTSTDDLYWGLGIPTTSQPGDYTGTTTFEAKSD